MPNPKKVFPQRFNDLTIGDLIFIILLFSVVGTTFMAFNEIKAGVIYSILLSSTSIILLLLTIMKKDEDQPTKIIPIPFAKKFSVSVMFYLLGLIAPILVSLIIGLFSLSLTSFTVPLFSGDITDAQSFSVANIEEQASTKLFNIVYVAGSDETLVYNWLAMLFGVVMGQIILRLLSKEGSRIKNPLAVKIIAYSFSILAFTMSHVLNSTYTSIGKFVVAGGFLLLSNISMFEWGIPVSFWTGFHQMNNFLYLLGILGAATIVSGFLGIFGAVTVALIGLLLFYAINNWDVMWRDFKNHWRSR